MSLELAFPLFSQTFFPMESSSFSRVPPPLLLDLKQLPREDGPPSETQLRKAKFELFSKQCSVVAPNLFLAGEAVAKNKDILLAHGISHVVNCVGALYKEFFKDDGLQYRTYYLKDIPSEDILAVLYDALEFIDVSLKAGGRVLVHCSQGVSRSATLVIAYLMWRSGSSYDEVYAQVKEARGITNPNIGFTCQLLQWQKRRQIQAPARIRMYRITLHDPQSPILVAKSIPCPKLYANNTWRDLDCRGAFLVHASDRIWIWIGNRCPLEMANSARYWAKLLLKYEHVQLLNQSLQGISQEPPIVEVHQGSEPVALATLLDPPLLDAESAKSHARRTSLAEELASSSTSFHPAPLGDNMEIVLPDGDSSSLSQSFDLITDARLESMLQNVSIPSISLPSCSCGWVAGENDEYSRDYHAFDNAARHGFDGHPEHSGGSVMFVPGAANAALMRGLYRSSVSDKALDPAAVLGAAASEAHCSPSSPATLEGRMRKCRRSESEMQLDSEEKPGRPPQWPLSLHMSMDEDMPTIE